MEYGVGEIFKFLISLLVLFAMFFSYFFFSNTSQIADYQTQVNSILEKSETLSKAQPGINKINNDYHNKFYIDGLTSPNKELSFGDKIKYTIHTNIPYFANINNKLVLKSDLQSDTTSQYGR